MKFEEKPTELLIRLARAGLGFSLNPDAKPSEEIKKIIHAAFEGGATVSFIGSSSSDNSKDLINN